MQRQAPQRHHISQDYCESQIKEVAESELDSKLLSFCQEINSLDSATRPEACTSRVLVLNVLGEYNHTIAFNSSHIMSLEL